MIGKDREAWSAAVLCPSSPSSSCNHTQCVWLQSHYAKVIARTVSHTALTHKWVARNSGDVGIHTQNLLASPNSNIFSFLSRTHFTQTCKIALFMSTLAFLGGTAVKNPPANAGDTRQGLDPWVRKSPWRRKRQHTPGLLPGSSHGQRILAATVEGVKESWTQLSH